MTRWAFVSDIHGNYRALLQAHAQAVAAGAERFVCLGDVIGRGEPAACVAWVCEQGTIAIVGNRDLDSLERVPPELRGAVCAWPREAAASTFVVSHGDPGLHPLLNARAERDGFRRASRYLAERGARLWFFGHTHRARTWEVTGAGSQPAPASVRIEPNASYVVNVGTTGLPLPGRGQPSFVLYDDVVGHLEHVLLARSGTGRPGLERSASARVL